MDTYVAQFYWTELSSGLALKARKGIANSNTGYGVVFLKSGPELNQTLQWAAFLTKFFEENEDNEDIMVSTAIQRLPKKVILK